MFPRFDGSQPCASMDPELFFQEKHVPPQHVVNTLRNVCNACHFKQECLEWGVRHEEHGWWGGCTPAEIALLRKTAKIKLERVHLTLIPTPTAGAA